jgi:3-oxoacyl-[acyl-carrier protein] reductase
MNFKGKIALITGAGRGIGREISFLLASRGAHVIVTDIAEGESPTTVEEIQKEGFQAQFFKIDVSKADEVNGIVQVILKQTGKVDILINNAGITRDNLIIRLKEEDWDQVLDVNLKGAFNMSKSVLPSMLKARYGRIINISSVIGMMGNAGQVNYAASKAGLIGFTKAMARELASRGITVNAVAPGYIDTEMTKAIPEDVKKKLIELIPAGRLGTTRDIADGVLFLCSDQSAYITGHVLSINGGMYM